MEHSHAWVLTHLTTDPDGTTRAWWRCWGLGCPTPVASGPLTPDPPASAPADTSAPASADPDSLADGSARVSWAQAVADRLPDDPAPLDRPPRILGSAPRG